MTDEQIALIKYAIRAENKKTAQVLGKLKVPVDDYESPLEKAFRVALALAEQARAMEGWEAVTYLRGDTIATRQGDGQWYIEDETRFQYLGYEGVWAGFESREVFADKESAIAAANAAMKAGLPPTAEESSVDGNMK
jgi:hypothetical protein